VSKADDASADARRKAQQLMNSTKRRVEEQLETRARLRREEDAKIAHLRTLRLAKEAADKAVLGAGTPSTSQGLPGLPEADEFQRWCSPIHPITSRSTAMSAD
jgi:hypothetical protein